MYVREHNDFIPCKHAIATAEATQPPPPPPPTTTTFRQTDEKRHMLQLAFLYIFYHIVIQIRKVRHVKIQT